MRIIGVCETVRAGAIGKLPQFWLMYIDMMKHQTMAHTAVQENDFNMRLHAWEYWLPFYFTSNFCNYARYGSYYLETLKNLDNLYPGLKEMLEKNGLSVQAQTRYPHRTAIYFFMHFCPGTITTHAESINSDLQRGQTFTTHTTLNTEQRLINMESRPSTEHAKTSGMQL